MENTTEIKKKIIQYSLTFVISFSLGLLFDHYVLAKEFIPEEENNTEEERVEEGNKDKPIAKEEGCSIYVDINGAVKNPGVYCLNTNSLLVDAVNKAGGFSKESSTAFIARKINLAQPISNNQKIYFPFEKELICQIVPLSQEAKKIEEMITNPVVVLPTVEPYDNQNTNDTEPTNNVDPECVNINTATKEQLTTLNGIGDSTAEKIIQGRPYANIEDLLNVSGIGESTLAKFKSEACI